MAETEGDPGALLAQIIQTINWRTKAMVRNCV